MNRDDVFDRLRRHRIELENMGAKSLFLFGSFARDSATAGSDIDLLVEFSSSPTFNSYMDLKFRLEEILGRKVDLVTRDALKPRLKPVVEREAMLVS